MYDLRFLSLSVLVFFRALALPFLFRASHAADAPSPGPAQAFHTVPRPATTAVVPFFLGRQSAVGTRTRQAGGWEKSAVRTEVVVSFPIALLVLYFGASRHY